MNLLNWLKRPTMSHSLVAIVAALIVGVAQQMRLAVPMATGAILATAGATSFTCVNCTPNPPKPPPPPMATGGTSPTGGASGITGGHPATGGSTQSPATTVPTCPTITWPSQPATAADVQAKLAHGHKFPEHSHHAPRNLSTQPQSTTACSSWNEPLVKSPLDQGSTGSCTGNAAVGMVSCAPFTDASHFNETTAQLVYEQGTCLDNGCALPCTCASCKAGYCEATDVNDNGSIGSSVSQALQFFGWIKGYLAADTTTSLIAGLSRSSCMVGVDWYNSMMSTSSSGQVVVTTSSGLAGGHQVNVIGYDADKQRVWARNSWGSSWGLCRSTGDCGYFWFKLSDLPKLNFDADCPVL